MKADLVIKLIEAHCTGQESFFEKALLALASDEERKGNLMLSQSLKNAYRQSNKTPGLNTDGGRYSTISNSGFVTKGTQPKVAPRDRESLLELYEIIYPTVKLDDVILPSEQKGILKQIIEEQEKASLLHERGLSPVNRILLCGPPGCGKTMTAMALTNELGLPMAYVRLDGLVSSFLGQTSTNLRKVFDAVRDQRIVLFLDEFDAIAKKRDDAHELGELKRVVTTLLQNFDNTPNNVFLVAATNHHHLLDPAIWRRFNMAVMLEIPGFDQRKALFENWLNAYPVSTDLDMELISKLSEGLNCSEIKEIVTSTAKSLLVSSTNPEIYTERIIDTLIKKATFHSAENSNEFWSKLKQLKKKGVSLRALERALGIPKSTLSDKLKEGDIDG